MLGFAARNTVRHMDECSQRHSRRSLDARTLSPSHTRPLLFSLCLCFCLCLPLSLACIHTHSLCECVPLSLSLSFFISSSLPLSPPPLSLYVPSFDAQAQLDVWRAKSHRVGMMVSKPALLQVLAALDKAKAALAAVTLNNSSPADSSVKVTGGHVCTYTHLCICVSV